MSELTDLRAKLTDQQHAIINTIWRYEQEKNRGIPAVTLYERFGSEEAVLAALDPLGGDVAYIPQYQDGNRRYYLTFVGYMLAEQGEELEKLLALYLEYARKQRQADSECQGLNLQEAMEEAKFSPEEIEFFKSMLPKTPFFNNNSNGPYELGLPPGLERWYFAPDMRKYVQERAMSEYDPRTPVDGGRRYYMYSSQFATVEPEDTYSVPPELIESLERFRVDYPDSDKVGFVMMQFGTTSAHDSIIEGIRIALNLVGMTAVRADDKHYHDDLLNNVLTYVYGCGFGIAVFERLENEIFNPNVSLEVGYMMALKKPVFLLKDKTLPTLHTDLVGRLYRTFDPQDPIRTVPGEVAK